MQIDCIDNYVYTKLLNLDLHQQKQNANEMYRFVQNTFMQRNEHMGAPSVSKKFTEYNYLMYPLVGMHNLYNEIKSMFYEINDNIFEEHYIQCWLNVYEKGEFIDWHAHWQSEYYAWHGFYCLDVEPNSYTTYRVGGKEISVYSKNNLLVMSKSDGDVHRSSEWTEDYPRITIAFDILPVATLQDRIYNDVNHWMPI